MNCQFSIPKTDVTELSSEVSTGYTNFGNRGHRLMSYTQGRVYFWHGAPPLMSSAFGHHLFTATSSLMSSFSWMTGARDCLLTSYRHGSDHLNFHADIFDGRPELVILLFAGGVRDLLFRIVGKKRHFQTISCTPDLCVIITPLANTLFQHAKSRSSHDSSPSLSFAYRHALSLVDACRRNRGIRAKLGIPWEALNLMSNLGL